MAGTLIVVIVIAIIVIILLIKTAVVVPQRSEYIVERLGKYSQSLSAGFHILVPFLDKVAYKRSLKEEVMNIPSQDCITSDNVSVSVDGIMYIQVMDSKLSAYGIEDYLIAASQLAQTSLRSVIGKIELDRTFEERESLNQQVVSAIDEAAQNWGVKVLRYEIKDITPPQSVMEAMEKQMKAEREKRAAILESEGVRQSAILEAEGEKQSAILEAEGRKESALRDAEARERLAQAEAEATRVVSDAIAKGDVQAINYFVAQKYMEALTNIGIADNQKVIFMPLESSGIIGALGGITELVKEAVKDREQR
jgi:regulator of protease activity HflC (stomatin/prohibitin superfamily)